MVICMFFYGEVQFFFNRYVWVDVVILSILDEYMKKVDIFVEYINWKFKGDEVKMCVIYVWMIYCMVYNVFIIFIFWNEVYSEEKEVQEIFLI